MAKTDQKGILSFQQDAGFYMRAARKAMDGGELIRALGMLRDAEKRWPGERVPFQVMQAEVLNRMQRFDQSLRLLLTTAPLELMPEEGVFGMASNYMAMEEFSAAHTCFEAYLRRWPEGDYSQECREYLALLADGSEMHWQLGLEDGEDPELIAHLHYAKAMHFSGLDQQSLEHLLGLESRYPSSLWLQMEIALDQFCVGDFKGAEQRVFNILKKDLGYVRAKCLLALIRLNEHKNREAREMMDSIPIPQCADTEVLGNMCAMLLEVKDYKRAEECAGMLTELLPYDPLSLHEEAVAKYMLGKEEEALARYDKILSIDPEDTVAAYYRTLVEHSNGKTAGRSHISTNYDVPYGEAFKRFERLKGYLEKGPQATKQAWEEEKPFHDLLCWAVYSPLFQAKKAVFSVLGILGDPEAERVCRDFLLRQDQSDADKQLAIGALKNLGSEGPYSLYYEGMWRYGAVQTLSLPADLPGSYRDLFEELEGLSQRYALPARTEEVARRLFYHYVQALEGDYPRMNREQRMAMEAALTAMSLHAMEQKYDPEQVCGLFGVTMRRMQNALNRLVAAIDTGEEEKEPEK